MRTHLKIVALAGVVALAAGACGWGDDDSAGVDMTRAARGGALRVALLADVGAAFDPQKEYHNVAWELFRCCLLRTLLSYDAAAGEEEGSELRPDLAAEMPEVSKDGLTWTFTLRQGVRYAPPMEDVEITARDFVRALEREADAEAAAGGYAFYYSVIKGFDEFRAGEADAIQGLKVVDDRTLRIRLTERVRDFGHRMAMPATAPIPKGAADGHEEDYGRFLVASGPYMFEGSDTRDLSLPVEEQEPVSGYVPGKSITLVRNPSWSPVVDDLRPANADRIEIAIGGTEKANARRVDAGELDLQLDGAAPPEQVRRYQTTPELKHRLFVHPSDSVSYLTMNLALPPFDDVHVRKALNLVLNKDSLRRIRGGPLAGRFAGHIMVDSLQDGLLADYDPYATPKHRGDLEAAKEEMAESTYDTTGDGMCDAKECRGVSLTVDGSGPYPDQAKLVKESLELLGIGVEVHRFDRATMYERIGDPSRKVGLGLGPGWRTDYPSAATFGEPLFGAASIGPDACCNYSLVGASEKLLKDLDYEVTEVPAVDKKIDACEAAKPGKAQFKCWAELDKKLMEDVVPWVPYLFENYVRTVSARVATYAFDRFSGLPALDHIALYGGGEPT